jgi:hypothetical protein
MTAIPDPTIEIEIDQYGLAVAPCTRPGCTEKRPHIHKDTLPKYTGPHLIEDDNDRPH